jgi:hypothetical protein
MFLIRFILAALLQSMDCLTCYSCDSTVTTSCADPAIKTAGLTGTTCAASQTCMVN